MDIISGGFLFPLIALGVIGVALLVLVTYARNYHRVPPHEMLIISGPKTKHRVPAPDPEDPNKIIMQEVEVGFDVMSGGTRFVLPFLQSAERMDMGVRLIQLTVDRALDSNGVKVQVTAAANVKIGSDRAAMTAAAMAFGGQSDEEIEKTLEETLVGGLRAVVAGLTIDSLYKDRDRFVQEVLSKVAPDFARLGHTIPGLVIKEVNDTEGYLDALGRKQVADAKRDAAVGEAEAKKEERERVAEARRAGDVAEIKAKEEVAQRQRDLDLKTAGFKQEVDGRQAEADQAGPLAKARAEQAVRVAQAEADKAERTAQIAVQEEEGKRKQAELDATVIKEANANKQRKQIEAEANKQQKLIEAEAQREAADDEAKAVTTRADAEKTRIILEGEGKADASKAQALADAEGKKATAEARQKELEAEAAGIKARLEAEADGRKAALEAEAAGTEAKLLAEAKGNAELAISLAKLDNTGKLLKVLEAAPLLAESIGDALAKALGPDGFAAVMGKMAEPLSKIESVRVLEMGGNNNENGGVMKIASIVPNLLFQTLANAKARGIDLNGLAAKFGISSDLIEDFMADLKTKKPSKTEGSPDESEN